MAKQNLNSLSISPWALSHDSLASHLSCYNNHTSVPIFTYYMVKKSWTSKINNTKWKRESPGNLLILLLGWFRDAFSLYFLVSFWNYWCLLCMFVKASLRDVAIIVSLLQDGGCGRYVKRFKLSESLILCWVRRLYEVMGLLCLLWWWKCVRNEVVKSLGFPVSMKCEFELVRCKSSIGFLLVFYACYEIWKNVLWFRDLRIKKWFLMKNFGRSFRCYFSFFSVSFPCVCVDSSSL